MSLTLGIGNALFQPAFLASVPNLVPARSLTSANALVGLTQSLAVTIGLPLGGFMVDQFGVDWGFSANALTFAFSAALVAGTAFPRGERVPTGSLHHRAGRRLPLRARQPHGAGRDRRRRDDHARRGRQVAAGVDVRPELADAGTTGLGVLGAIWGVGMLVGSLIVSRIDRVLGHARMLTCALLMVSAAVILAAWSPILAPVALLWIFGGIGNTTGTVAYEVILQERTEDAVRGRVMAALEASVQAGLLCGVGIAALTDMLFRGHDPARFGLTPGRRAVRRGRRGSCALDPAPQRARRRAPRRDRRGGPRAAVDGRAARGRPGRAGPGAAARARRGTRGEAPAAARRRRLARAPGRAAAGAAEPRRRRRASATASRAPCWPGAPARWRWTPARGRWTSLARRRCRSESPSLKGTVPFSRRDSRGLSPRSGRLAVHHHLTRPGQGASSPAIGLASSSGRGLVDPDAP